MNALAIPMLSWKKLNTYGVESPCKRFPGVGSFLANPGVSKAQLVPSCEMRTFILRNSSIGIPAQYQRRCVVTTYKIAKFIHWNIGTISTALHDAGIYIAIFIHWNTGITPTALPVGNTLNIGCLHLKNMKIYVDVFTFISQFFISTHIHFRPFTYKPQLAK